MGVVQLKSKRAIYKDLYQFKPANVLILGNDEVKEKLHHYEYKYNIVFKVCSTYSMIKRKMNDKTIAVIIDENFISQINIEKNFSLGETPIFFLSRKKRRASFYTRLYTIGVHGVINWPQEQNVLGDFLIESLKPKPLASGQSLGDQRLASTIKAHLIIGHGKRNIRVSVFEGFVFLSGKLSTLEERESIEKDVSQILGVKKLISKDLVIRVSKSNTSKELERRVKLYAGTALGKYKRALAFKVKDNILTILGDVESLADLNRITEFAKRQKGIIKIVNNVQFRPELVKKRSKRAKLIEEKAKDLFDGVKFISIAIYDSYAEVSGSVRFPADRLLVERYLLQVLPVKKIVNKLYILSSR